MELYRQAWEESYGQKDNLIFYPKEEVLKFISRNVRKLVGFNKFNDILDFTTTVRGLDFGCGIGRQAILMEEFGMEAHGLDISANAIAMAQEMALYYEFPQLKERFQVFDGKKIPFPDKYFDVSVCEAVLDSMTFDLACRNIQELSRVTGKLAYVSLISGDGHTAAGQDFNKEEIVTTRHEKGTVQCYYNSEKIDALLASTEFVIKGKYLQKEISLIPAFERGRYSLVLVKKN
jgi:ubiquinone/menaquinone biosynthesis C-methylase UbiE